MSWPKLAFRQADGKGRTSYWIKSWDGHEAVISLEHWSIENPSTGFVTVKREDILWVNTEAATRYDFSGIRVLGVGYGADEKLAAHLESKPK